MTARGPMSQTFAPITDAELIAAGFTHRTGSTSGRVIEGVERDPERVVVYSVRKPFGIPYLVFRRGVWQLPTFEALTHVRGWLSVREGIGQPSQPEPLNPALVPKPLKGTDLDVLSLVTVRRLVPALLGRLFNAGTAEQLLALYDARKKRR